MSVEPVATLEFGAQCLFGDVEVDRGVAIGDLDPTSFVHLVDDAEAFGEEARNSQELWMGSVR